MKAKLFCLFVFPIITHAALTTNSWTNSVSGKWEDASKWSAGAPSLTDATILITNASGKFITIDSATTVGSLTVTSLTIRGVGAAFNQLQVTNLSAATPLHMINALTLGTNGVLTVRDAVVQVDGMHGGFVGIDGTVNNEAGGVLVTTNATFILGNSRPGTFVNNGTLLAGTLTLGNLSVATATLKTSGACIVSNSFHIGEVANVTGTVWVLNGQLTAPNANPLSIGNNGIGSLTLSNGTALASNVQVSAGSASQGRLTVAGGTFTVNGFLRTGGTSVNATGTVVVAGGFLVATNAQTTIGSGGPSQLTISNGVFACSNIIVGGSLNSQGTLSIAGGTNQLSGPLVLGSSGSSSASATGTLLVTGGLLSMTNQSLSIGDTFSRGNMVVTSGTVAARNITVAAGSLAQGTLTMSGGTIELADPSSPLLAALTIGGGASQPGQFWLSGGQLIVTNNVTEIGGAGLGVMTISNGTFLAGELIVATTSFTARGTLTVAGGTLAASGPLTISEFATGSSTGAVWITGGQFVITNQPSAVGAGNGFRVDGAVLLQRGSLTVSNQSTVIGNRGAGSLTVNGGSLLLRDLTLGAQAGHAIGTLTLNGGTMRLTGSLTVGSGGNSTGVVWLTGGDLFTTNVTAVLGNNNNGTGVLTISNGTWLARNVTLGTDVGSSATLNVAGGATIISSNLTIGDRLCVSTGLLNLVAGTLAVTNAAGTAVLDLESGAIIQTGGTLIMDNLIITNPCAHYIKTGGSFFILTNLAFDPNGDSDADGMPNGFESDNLLLMFDPRDAAQDKDGDGLSNLEEFLAGTSPTNSASAFRITDITRQSNNLRITWTMGPGKTNALERTAGAAGSFSNDFAAIFTVTNTVGTTTNYLDAGAATNVPAFYYRVRLVP